MRDLEMKWWMGKCKRAWHYKVVRFWQVSLQRVAGGLFNVFMNKLEDTQLAKLADDQKIVISIKLGVLVIQSDLVPWERNPSKQDMGFTVGSESAGMWGDEVLSKTAGKQEEVQLCGQQKGRSECHVAAGEVSTALGCRSGNHQARGNHCCSHCRSTDPGVCESGRMLKNCGGFSEKPWELLDCYIKHLL